MSILETEYMAISHRIRELVWICRLINKVLLEQVVRRIEMLSKRKISLTMTQTQKVRIKLSISILYIITYKG